MFAIQWLEDKEKNGEMFTNSYCFTYCLKCFKEEHRVELWGKGFGYANTYRTEAGAIFEYQAIKGLTYDEIIPYVENRFQKK